MGESYSLKEAISKKYYHEIEQINRFQELEHFFEIEAQLLHAIHHLEADNAKSSLLKIIDILSVRYGKNVIRATRQYFIILSSVVTRNLIEHQTSPKKAFAFNAVCIDMIENNMSDGEFLQFANELIDFYIYVISNRKMPAYKHQTVNRVITYINDEVESDLSVEGISSYFNISTSHLSRIFKENVGITLVEYLNIRRVEESQYFLRHTNKPLVEVAEQFNFCNQSYYTRIFKKYVGITPKQFKDQKNFPYFRHELPEAIVSN